MTFSENNFGDRVEFYRSFFGEQHLPPKAESDAPPEIPGDLVTCESCGDEYMLTVETCEQEATELGQAVQRALPKCPNCVDALLLLLLGDPEAN